MGPAACTSEASTKTLLVLEAWNLLVIAASLFGFSHVSALAACRATWWGIRLAALGTVGVTGYALKTWLAEGQLLKVSFGRSSVGKPMNGARQ